MIDHTLCNGRRQVFYDDGIEICIDGGYEQSSGFDNNDLQLGKPIKSYWIQEMNMNYEGVIHKYMPTTNGYSMEFAIPWKIINTIPAEGMQVGFNIINNDDDDATNDYNLPSQKIWNGNSDYYKSPQNWGTIQLSAETTDVFEPYLALLTPNEGEFLISGKIAKIEWIQAGISHIKIEYSIDNGNTWSSITESTDAKTGYYDWTVNAQASNEVVFRISDITNTSISDRSEQKSIISEALKTKGPLNKAKW